MPLADPNENELWLLYRGGADSAARERLFDAYSPWAVSIASALFRQYKNRMVEREDYIQNAKVGLLEAMSRYDPDRGVPFRLYAHPRVRGSVINGLRTMQEKTASQQPDDTDWRDDHARSGSDDAFESMLDTIVHLSLGHLLESMSSAAAHHDDGFSYASNRQIESRLSAAIDSLPQRHRDIIVEHYYRHVPFREIATRLGLTRGRISQLHHDALGKIRSALREFQTSHGC